MSITSSRREFLKHSALAGAVTLGGAAWAETAVEAAGPLDMAIARWKGGDSPVSDIAVKLTEQALEALGGMKRFVSKGDVVWIKPNIGWDRTPEQAGNTNPDVVKTLVRMCLDAGAKTIKVGDNPCNPAEKTYVTSKIGEYARDAGAEIVFLDANRYRDMDIGGERLKMHPVYPEIVECDLVISVPITKHHSATKMTNCMKNFMGVVEKRQIFHQDLPTCIADITAFMKPRIAVMDAVRILTANGPTGGDLKDVRQPNIIAAGTDLVALDAFGAELLGQDPKTMETVMAGEKRGLGVSDYHSLKLKELDVA
ncbi:MAG: hypothetical protein BWX80_03440 [Candidatus Hydrogenedentes bacterium ADurb.Bin101]|jgi:uncharacterized protein (DUF362 family)|nr:MAG: hypothetical protein BWX80_03440 [Candidatus Hydrogenedentes bacterium ADurb.Bin101]HOC67692.1 DUF362 domain-containing protein [Candidatus Hydrogenedentota bacterium]